jgi:hypothetical protein
MKDKRPVGNFKRAKTTKILLVVRTLNEATAVFPALKHLLFEAFWFLLALLEIVRFLKGLA